VIAVDQPGEFVKPAHPCSVTRARGEDSISTVMVGPVAGR